MLCDLLERYGYKEMRVSDCKCIRREFFIRPAFRVLAMPLWAYR